METLLQDLRYAARMLKNRPGFTVVAVLSLALGIGANTAIFSLVNAVLLKPLPFREPDRLVMVWEDSTNIGIPHDTPAPANYADWRAQNRAFEDMAAVALRSFNLTGDGEPEKIDAFAVTQNFFPLLGAMPVAGRAFLPEEDKPEAHKTVIINYGLWQNRYGGDPAVVGRDILLNGEKHTVVGVMPAGFQFLYKDVGLWVPIAFTPKELSNRNSHYLNVVARMKAGATLEQARADIGAISARIASDYPNQAENLKAFVSPLHEELAGEVRGSFLLLLGAVGFVLLIACANVASMLLARAASRRKEIAVRAALGAGRLRIARQLLTESMLLAAAGGAVGLLLAVWSFDFLQQLVPKRMALSASLSIDGRVLLFMLLLSLLTGLIFGLVPALQASKIDLNGALKQGGGRTGIGADNRRLRSAMVMMEVALAMTLLVGAGLLIQTFYKLRGLDLGFRPENILTLRTVLPESKYAEHPKRVAFYNEVLERVSALPGVISAGYTTTVPLVWKGGSNGFSIEGRLPQPGSVWNANHRQVSANYLKAMGIPLREGRSFDDGDNERSLPAAVVNETMARKFWPNESAVGKRFKIGPPESERPWITIVGIAGDVRQMGIQEPAKAEMYLLYKQVTYHLFFAPRDLVVKTSGNPMDMAAAVRQEIKAADPDQPVSNIRTMDEVIGNEVAQRRLGTILLAAFASLALLLAAIGIYGVLSYFVVQQTPEIGVRIALGAQPRDIIKLVLNRGMKPALAGVAAGLLISLALTRWIASLLYGVSASDPATFILLALLLTGVALAACWIPARRAMRIDPITALRYE